MKITDWVQATDQLAKNEADVTNAIRSWLKANAIFHWKQWQGPMSGMNGVSDIIGIFQGRMLALEVKGPHWEPPKDPRAKSWKRFQKQREFIVQVRQHGGIADFVISVEDVIKLLNKFK